MKTMTLLGLFFAVTMTCATAGDKKDPEYDHDRRYRMEEKYIELNNLVIQLQYDFARHLSHKDNLIDELENKIVLLESDLFQVTQSLRNLELEVWDMKKSAVTARKSDE